MRYRYFSRAVKLYMFARYKEALRVLEPEIIQHQHDEQYFLLLGLCCIRCHNINDAIVYLKRGLRIDEGNIDILQALAVVFYMQKHNQNSINHLLDILDTHPKHKKANAFLEFIKLHAVSKISSKNVHQVYPFLPAVTHKAKIVIVAIASSIIVLVSASIFTLIMLWDPGASISSTRVGTEEIIRAKKIEQYISLGTNSIYTLNNTQIAELLNDIEQEFLLHRDNMVCIHTNRILNSNAHAELKQRMLFLRSYLSAPTFTSLTESFSYTDVITNPYLYNSCYIRWTGAVANIATADSLTQFDFLVGYNSDNILEGVAKSTSSIEYDFHQNTDYEIIAQIGGSSTELMLYVIAIRPLFE